MRNREVAEKFVKDCLAISYGSAGKGIRWIGQRQFQETVKKVLKTMPSKGQNMKRIAMLLLFILVASSSAFAQRHIAFGYVYQPNERDHGGWVEGAFDIGSRLQVPMTYTRFADEKYFAELAAGARIRLYEHVWVEAAYGLGRYGKGGLRSYIAGLVLETPAYKKHVAGVARFDFSAEKVAGLAGFNRFRPYIGLKVIF